MEIFERDGVAHIVKMKPGSLAGAFSSVGRMPGEADMRALVKGRAAKKFAGDDE